MRKSLTVVLAITLMACVGNAVAQVAVRQISLSWENTDGLEGEGLYNSLCSTCHGISGKGDGPASNVLEKNVPDLTMIAFGNEGVYPHQKVRRAIRGSSRDIAHGTIDMPDWEQQFMYVGSGWSKFTREAYARKNIKALSEYIETLQLSKQPDRVIELDH